MAGAERENYSIVEYLGGNDGHRCGYCGNCDTNYSLGFWAHSLTIQDYQDLIDRGWRRSGKYCYKPTMKKTCCPHYTIKQEGLNFKISNSQKKVIKMVNRYLNDDKKQGEGGPTGDKAMTSGSEASSSAGKKDKSPQSQSETTANEPRPGAGPDPSKPPCKKAKVLRMEKKAEKLAQSQKGLEAAQAKPANQPKSIEDFVNEIRDDPKHKLEIRLVRSSPRSDEFNRTFAESYAIYKKYQIVIHKDPPHKPSEKQYTRFLVDSPLQAFHKPGGPSHGYGSFHQQYWLDGKIIMVGVVDILPHCISSVYLYYDPDFGFLSPGTYSALREIEFMRSLNKKDPQIKYYYMGYYIHSCPKMRYKGQYYPSFLLCPEVYTWHPIAECTPKLDASAYSRFAESGKVDANSDIDLSQVLVLYERQPMPYAIYSAIQPSANADQVKEYAKLVGKKCAERMLLYRS